MMNKIIGGFALLAVSTTAIGQEPENRISIDELSFKSKEIDIGEVMETDPPKVVKFPFTNISSKPFEIQNVISSCGCTVANWPKKPVQPGESSEITVSFNPSGMFGDLEKHIKIRANLHDAAFLVLKITGYINSSYFDKPKYYKGQYGYLLLQDYRLNFGETPRLNQSKTMEVKVFNDGDDSIAITGFDEVPSFLNMSTSKTSIAPGDSARVIARFNGNDSIVPGVYKGSMKFNSTDRFYPTKGLNYFVEILPDFSNWSRRQMRKAPKAELLSPEVNMGNMKAGGISESHIQLKNSGKSPLRIYRFTTDCSCAVLSPPSSIDAGETVNIPVKFDALFKEGHQSKVITLYTNDPTQPKLELLVKAFVGK